MIVHEQNRLTTCSTLERHGHKCLQITGISGAQSLLGNHTMLEFRGQTSAEITKNNIMFEYQANMCEHDGVQFILFAMYY